MSENKAKKLFGSITNIGDDIIEEAQAIVSRALRFFDDIIANVGNAAKEFFCFILAHK